MSEKTQCKGGCGDEKAHGDIGKGGYALARGDKYLEYVCDACWARGVRTTPVDQVKTE